MSSGAPRTTTKDNRDSLTLATESPTSESTGMLDTPPDVLKNLFKITKKIWNYIYITYIQRNQVDSLHQLNARKYARKSDISGKDIGWWSAFLPKNSLPTDALYRPQLAKTNRLVSPQMECWNGLNCANVTYTGNVF